MRHTVEATLLSLFKSTPLLSVLRYFAALRLNSILPPPLK